MNTRKITLFCINLLPLAAMAGVNIQNGNFYISYKDVAAQSGGRELALSRTYNSLATTRGWFGYGWGSAFETRLIALPDHSAAVQENGNGMVRYYRPAGRDNVAAGVERIVAGAVERDKLSPAAAAELRQQLQASEELRLQKTQDYALQAELPDGTVLQSNECAAARLTRQAEGYLRTNCEGGSDHFDLQGRLLRREARDGYQIRADYAGVRPQTITDSLGQTLRFEWTADGHVAKLEEGATRVLYSYDARGNLIRSNTIGGHAYDYAYDDKHNLTRIGYADTSSLQIAYAPPHSGRASAVIERTGDKTEYEYGSDPADAQRTWTRIVHTAADGRQRTRQYDFRRQRTASGEEWVASIAADAATQQRRENGYDEKGRIVRRVDRNGIVSEYVYHPVSGKLILVFDENGVTTAGRQFF